MTQSRRALVTGGAGFLGSHLCERLLALGWHVTAIDNLQTGSFENVQHLAANERFHLELHDVTAPYEHACDVLFNLACAASPPKYQQDPVHTMLTNVLGTYHGLCLAEKTGAMFVQASTSEVYGDPEIHPQAEDYHGNVAPHGPRACYDEGKRSAEALVMDFHRQYGVPVRIARIFNTYGPRMATDDGRVVSNFITQALQSEPLTIYGTGSQTRSLCFVSDLIDGLLGLVQQSAVIGPVNLGNPAEHTVVEIAEHVLRLVAGGKLNFLPLPEHDPKRRKPDITVAKNAFGFAPKVPFDEGLRATIDDFRQRLRVDFRHPSDAPAAFPH